MSIHFSIKGIVSQKSIDTEKSRKSMRTTMIGDTLFKFITFSVTDTDTTVKDGEFVKEEGRKYRLIAFDKTAEEILEIGGQEVLFICDKLQFSESSPGFYSVHEFYLLYSQ